jgi:tetratricopeptide (TPR) repeat protein
VWWSTFRPPQNPAHAALRGLLLLRRLYFSIYGKELPAADAKRIAPKLYGHPVAARLVAGLLGDHSVDFLEKYPHEMIALRRDLARTLLQGISLTPVSERLMEMLALAATPLPAQVIVATGFSDDEFQQAIAQCASAGLLTADVAIETHPLFREFYWHRLHRSNYRERAAKLAEVLAAYLERTNKTSPEFVSLLPVAFRCYALAGELDKATRLRRDLSGELEATAVLLYNRRNYDLADQYISHLLDGDKNNWRMRFYRARIRIRQEQWSEADQIFSQMLGERPTDVSVLHAMGWSQMRQGHGALNALS